ncbi:MAG: VCBS repeat-containing protein, partial [Bacteroidota bacterium]
MVSISLNAQLFGLHNQLSGGFIDNPRSIDIADIDGDGDLDVVSASFTDSKICWFENIDNVFHRQHIVSLTLHEAIHVSVGDVNADGHMDIIACGEENNQLGWYENDGNGNFSSIHLLEYDLSLIQRLYVEDYDEDGDA